MAKTKGKKKGLFMFLKEFFNGVKGETKKIMWTSKKNLIKYSIATLVFMLFICLFFVGTDLLIALITYIKELIG